MAIEMIIGQNGSSVPPARYSRAEKKKNLLFKTGRETSFICRRRKSKEKEAKRKPKTSHIPYPQIASWCHANGVPERKRRT